MNQVATKKEGALATNLFEADANQGAQNISQEDLALPFLKILGQLSPEVNKRELIILLLLIYMRKEK